jgi:hypothetical protein
MAIDDERIEMIAEAASARSRLLDLDLDRLVATKLDEGIR